MSDREPLTAVELHVKPAKTPKLNALGHFVYDDSYGHGLYFKFDALEGVPITSFEKFLAQLIGKHPMPTFLTEQEGELSLGDLVASTAKPLMLQLLDSESFLTPSLEDTHPNASSFFHHSRINQRQLLQSLKLTSLDNQESIATELKLDTIHFTHNLPGMVRAQRNGLKVSIERDETLPDNTISLELRLFCPKLTHRLAEKGLNPDSNHYGLSLGRFDVFLEAQACPQA